MPAVYWNLQQAGAKMRVFRTTVVLAVAAAMLGGCRRSQLVEDLAPQLAPDTQTVILEVQNHNWSDIIIYVVHDGRRTRLNVVTATKDASLVIPASIIGISIFSAADSLGIK